MYIIYFYIWYGWISIIGYPTHIISPYYITQVCVHPKTCERQGRSNMSGRYSGLFLFACSAVVATLLKKKSSKAETKDDMSKSVKQYDRHFIIIDREPSQWEKRLENEKNNAVA